MTPGGVDLTVTELTSGTAGTDIGIGIGIGIGTSTGTGTGTGTGSTRITERTGTEEERTRHGAESGLHHRIAGHRAPADAALPHP
ncbi:hypothetical protein ABWJ92_08880 [Streptomyces sp. NPDC000609]|uniref:hypothetical protein n=1 Tax=Streptomyces sp. NPDC000609 TaxID=3160957 RepID=UPI00339A113F